jgi:predicted SnoaL-like aldol condensation-catalyzing enzyme
MSTHLTPEQMKQFVRNHFEDFVNKRDASVIRKNMTADFYDHDGPGGKPCDAAVDEQMMLGMYAAMPDLRISIEDMVAEGDKVVCRNVWRWTEASGKKMQFHGFVLWRFEGDKIAERWATVTPPSEAPAWSDQPAGAKQAAS